MENVEVWQWLVGQLVVAAAIWGGIRKDIINIHRRLDDMTEALGKAHERIDRWFENHHS
jgi:hypothetical protein